MLRKENFFWRFLTAAVIFLSVNCPVSFAATEIESLIEVLVNKGVLSQGDAVQIIEEAEAEAKMQQINAVKKGPRWLANTTFKGDLRIRHQYENKESDTSEPEQRFRTRLRYGVETDINSKLTVGARFATGSNDTASSPDGRSTNQTWGDVFSNWDFNIDEAYFDWQPFDAVQMIGGKRQVKKLMMRNSDLIWDGDLTFDGGTIKLTAPKCEGFEAFSYIGGYLLQSQAHDKLADDNQNNNPWMMHIQPGFTYKQKTDKGIYNFKGAVSYLGLRNTADQATSAVLNSKYALNGNSTNADGTLKYSYDVIYPTIAFEYNWGGPKNKTYAFKVNADYIYNPDPKDTGYLLGTKIGYKKVGKRFGDWQFGYNFRYLEDDAFLAAFSDSDAYSGHTNVKGHETTLQVGLAKNVTLGLDYYFMEPISGNNRTTEQIVQSDVVFKF